MNKKSLMYLFLIPLLLCCWTIWQNVRISDEIARIDYSDRIMQQAQQADPGQEMAFNFGDEHYRAPASELLKREQSYRDKNKGLEIIAQVKHFLAKWGMLFALLSLIISGGWVALCRYGVRAGQKSPQQLTTAFRWCRHLLPLVMIMQVILSNFAVTCLVLYEVVWGIVNFELRIRPGFVVFMMLAIVAILGWVVLKTIARIRHCFPRSPLVPKPVQGLNITRADAPALWQWVEQLAARLGTITPDNIVVGLAENFYVTANPIALNGADNLLTGQTLHFSLSWAALLNQQEVTAVVGHELGHFSGQDTQYSLRFNPLYDGMESSIEAFARPAEKTRGLDRQIINLSLYCGIYCLEQFHGAVRQWSRSREFVADQMGARASSPQALSSALLRIAAASETVDDWLARFFNRELQSDNVVHSLLAELQVQPLPDPRHYMESETSHPYDTHPSCRARIEALGCDAEQAARTAARPVVADEWRHLTALFPSLDEMAQQLSGGLSGQVAAWHQEARRELESVAGGISGDTPLYNGLGLCYRGTMVGVLMLATALVLSTDMKLSYPLTRHSIFSLVIVLLFLYFSFLGFRRAWRQWKKIRQPFMVLTPEAIHFRDLSEPVPFAALTDYLINPEKKEFALGFWYREGYEPPVKNAPKYVMMVDKEERLFVVTYAARVKGANGKKLKKGELAALVDRYFSAAHARAALQDDAPALDAGGQP